MSDKVTGSNAFVKAEEAKKSKGAKTVKAESQELVAAHDGRVELYVCNPSEQEVWLALGSEAKKSEGIWLKKQAGSVTITGYTGVVSCVTTEGEGTITYAEV